MDQRERFEAGYLERYPIVGWLRPSTFKRDFYGEYELPIVEASWQMWQAAEAAALERAAQVCASYSVDKWNLYKGRAPYNGSESGRANPYVEGQSDGAEECAADIRKLAAPVERKPARLHPIASEQTEDLARPLSDKP